MTVAAIYACKSTDQNVADEEKSVTRQVERARAIRGHEGIFGNGPNPKEDRRLRLLFISLLALVLGFVAIAGSRGERTRGRP
jgi:hypothetical protein